MERFVGRAKIGKDIELKTNWMIEFLLRDLSHPKVIVAICSKNKFSEKEIKGFRNHPEILSFKDVLHEIDAHIYRAEISIAGIIFVNEDIPLSLPRKEIITRCADVIAGSLLAREMSF